MSLDNVDPYNDPIPISSGQTPEIHFTDTPAVPLNTGYKKMEVDPMNFVVYIMYKSDSEGSIWIPVAKMDWGWQAIAESSDGGNTWSKTSGAHTTSNPAFSETTEFPEYDDTVTGYSPYHPDWESD